MNEIESPPSDINLPPTRTELIRACIDDLHAIGKKPTATLVMTTLKDQGHSYPYTTVNKDFNRIRDDSNFISNLTVATLSAEIEDISSNLDYVIKEARLASENGLGTIKTVKKEMPDGKTITETTTVPNDPRVKMAYLKLIGDVSKQKEALLLGRTLDISAASANDLVNELRRTNIQLKSRLVKYEAITDMPTPDKKFIVPKEE